MAPKKKVSALIKLQIQAGKANPAPPLGPALGSHGVNIMDFCKQYNAQTQDKMGQVIPVEITVYEDRSFTFILKTPPAAALLLKAAGIQKGTENPLTHKVGSVTKAQLREIAETAQEVGRQQELLAAQQQALDSTRRKIDAQRARYERDQRNAKARLQRMSAREKAVLREKERQEEQLDTAIAELQKLTKGNKAGASFSTRTSNLNLPVEGGRVKRYRDNMAEITGPKGARITAIYEGKVVDVKRNRITNRFDVYIAHGQYITSYANLNSVSVAKGQTVAKNSAIGVIGPAVDIQTMKTEYRLVFGIYPPAGAKKMRASDCFRK